MTNTSPSADTAAFSRKHALDVLAAAPVSLLAEHYSRLATEMPAASAVRGPKIGTVMVRGKIGGGGAAYNLGEASVTRATVKLETGEVGHSIILGRDQGKARIVAHLDALRQVSNWQQRIDDEITRPILLVISEEKQQRAEETEATKVDFFTVTRGED